MTCVCLKKSTSLSSSSLKQLYSNGTLYTSHCYNEARSSTCTHHLPLYGGVSAVCSYIRWVYSRSVQHTEMKFDVSACKTLASTSICEFYTHFCFVICYEKCIPWELKPAMSSEGLIKKEKIKQRCSLLERFRF